MTSMREPAPTETCPPGFKKLWASFVETVVDVAHAQGPAAPRRPPGRAPHGPARLPAASRLVAIGDLHGDFEKARRTFRVAGLIDEQDRWAGGTATAVQLGDVLDRGDDEVRLLYWLERLQREAVAAGGALHLMNGNHEIMGAVGDTRYATDGAAAGFERWTRAHALELALKGRCGCFDPGAGHGGGHGGGDSAGLHTGWRAQAREFWALQGMAARDAALRVGSGPLARRFLEPRPVVLQVGSSLFVHGGLLPAHATRGLEALNRETAEWLAGGSGPRLPRFLAGRAAVVWARDFSAEDPAVCDCAALERTLAAVPGSKRMVVGHTIQEQGINTACGGKVYRVDVGVSRGCMDGTPAALEIRHDNAMQRLMERVPPPAATNHDGIAATQGSRTGRVAA